MAATEMNHLPESGNQESRATTHRCSVCGRNEGHCHRCHQVHKMLEFWPLWVTWDQKIKKRNRAEDVPDWVKRESRKHADLVNAD